MANRALKIGVNPRKISSLHGKQRVATPTVASPCGILPPSKLGSGQYITCSHKKLVRSNNSGMTMDDGKNQTDEPSDREEMLLKKHKSFRGPEHSKENTIDLHDFITRTTNSLTLSSEAMKLDKDITVVDSSDKDRREVLMEKFHRHLLIILHT